MMGAVRFVRKLPFRTLCALRFILSYTEMKVRANMRVSLDILRERPDITPAIVAYPLEADSDFEIFLLSALLTMIPATLSVDLSEDERTLYIHGLYVDDERAFIREVKEKLEIPIRRFCE